jgi:hypothetical protein
MRTTGGEHLPRACGRCHEARDLAGDEHCVPVRGTLQPNVLLAERGAHGGGGVEDCALEPSSSAVSVALWNRRTRVRRPCAGASMIS